MEPELQYLQLFYSVGFEENTLPAGTLWNVTLGGVAQNSTGGAIQFQEPNGTYAYTVGNSGNWFPLPGTANGTLTLAGESQSIPIRFALAYMATFVELGLPSGTTWGVTLNGTYNATAAQPAVDGGAAKTPFSIALFTNGSRLSTTLPNGVYTFVVHDPTGYSASPSSGTITIHSDVVLTLIRYASTTTATISWSLLLIFAALAAIGLLSASVLGAYVTSHEDSDRRCRCILCAAAYRNEPSGGSPDALREWRRPPTQGDSGGRISASSAGAASPRGLHARIR